MNLYNEWKYVYPFYEIEDYIKENKNQDYTTVLLNEPVYQKAKFVKEIFIKDYEDLCLFCEYDDCFRIVFRGTSNIRAFFKNFDALPLKDEIHEGAWESWLPFMRETNTLLPRHRGRTRKRIICQGMSRGGPGAILCARHLVKNRGYDPDKVKLITYGSYAIGSSLFQSDFHTLGIEAYRVVNGYDIVTNAARPLKHVGLRVWLPQPFYHRWFHRIRDHIPKNYNRSLQKWDHLYKNS